MTKITLKILLLIITIFIAVCIGWIRVEWAALIFGIIIGVCLSIECHLKQMGVI
jgi:hypothetical protein